ncbi:hypothetical protein N2152v2_010319 [Parachlorella kessleri]
MTSAGELVHNDSAVFRYDVIKVNLSLENPRSKQTQNVPLYPEQPVPVRPELPSERHNGNAELDYLAFDAPAAPVEDAIPASGVSGPATTQPAAEPLEEFIPLGPPAGQQPSGTAAAAGASASAAAVQGTELLSRVPWLRSLKGIRSPLLRLHQEIAEFCRYLAPSEEESEQRQAALERVSGAVQSIWPSAEVKVFGSFATGLYLPTSDVDAVVVDSGCADVPAGLKALAQSLLRKKLAKNVQVIAKAKVPIIKFEEAESGYNFDVSFDVANGPEAAENVRDLMDSLPPMRPLVMVLKVFLQQRDLNEVYSGGLGSYALLVMVAAFLQLHPSRQPSSQGGQRFSGAGGGSGGRQQAAAPLETNLGVLLVDFFRLYGRSLNNDQVGVSCRRGGSFFNKRNKGFWQAERPWLLAVEDPNDPDNDLGRNSYNISRVRSAFDWAYNQLTAPSAPSESLLQRIMRLDPVLFARQPPQLFEAEEEEGGYGDREARREKRGKRERRRQQDGKQGKRRRERSMSGDADEGAQRAQREGKRHKHGHNGGASGRRAYRDSDHEHRQRQQPGSGHMQVKVTPSGSRHIRFD